MQLSIVLAVVVGHSSTLPPWSNDCVLISCLHTLMTRTNFRRHGKGATCVDSILYLIGDLI